MDIRDAYEYTLLLVKPDGIEKNLTKFILNYLKTYGLKEVCRNSIVLTKSQVSEFFVHKHNDRKFKEYMTRGPSTAILLKGENAFQKLRILKNHIRKMHNASIIENILHSSEAGNEYDSQFRIFFPNLDISRFTLFADLYAKITFPTDYEEFCKKLEYIQENSSVKAIAYIVNNDVFSRVCDHFNKYYNADKFKIPSILGLEYYTKINDHKFKLLGYYKIDGNIKMVGNHSKYSYDDIHELIKIILESRGVPFFCKTNDMFNFDVERFIELKKMGICGGVAYDPSYTIYETEFLRDNILGNGMLIAGGSGGLTQVGRFGVSYEIFNEIYKLIYGEDCLDIKFLE